MLDKIKFKKLWFVLLVLPLIFTPVYLGKGTYLGITLGPLFMPIGWAWSESSGYVVETEEPSNNYNAENGFAKKNGSYAVADGKGGVVSKEFRKGDFIPAYEQRSSRYFYWTFENHILERTRRYGDLSYRRFKKPESYNEDGDITPWLFRPGFWLDYIVEHQIRDYPHEDLNISWSRILYWEAWMLAICVVVNRKRLLQDKEQ